MENQTLKLADYIVITITMCISVGIGLYYRFSGGRQKTTQVNCSMIYLLKKFLQQTIFLHKSKIFRNIFLRINQ